jgi:Helix-turn-helix domain
VPDELYHAAGGDRQPRDGLPVPGALQPGGPEPHAPCHEGDVDPAKASPPASGALFARVAQRVIKDDELSDAACRCYSALASHWRGKGSPVAWPGIKKLQADLGKGRSTVFRLLSELEEAGWIARIALPGKLTGYRLLASEPLDDTRPTYGTGPVPEVGRKLAGPPTGDELEKREEQAPTPRCHATNRRSTRTRSLFERQEGQSLQAGLAYHLAERPELAGLAAWFPELAADFWCTKSWHRPSEIETALAWARRLAAIAATEGETRAAFEWALSTPTGVFSRPDYLSRILGRIKAKRQEAARGAASTDHAPTALGAEVLAAAEAAWAQATEAEREQARARAGAHGLAPGGRSFDRECRLEVLAMHQAAAEARVDSGGAS